MESRYRSIGTGQGICDRWANPSQSENIQQLQDALDFISDFQRNHYEIPKRNYKTRIELFPELEKNTRIFQINQFDINNVYQFLEQQVWNRRVNKKGTIHFFNHEIYISRKLANLKVFISFDKIEKQWIIRNKEGLLLKTSYKAIPNEKEINPDVSGCYNVKEL